ncbi:MAG: hypothetical protein R3E42_16035 [Burkholderiaceae bacterium]
MRSWLGRWRLALGAGRTPAQTAAALRAANPVYIPRNHLVEEALEAATERDDLAPFNALLAVLKAPFDERPGLARFAQPASAEQQAGYRTFCGT